MTRYTRVRLAPRGPFHFGGRGVGMEHSEVGLPADSLFSALCVTLGESAGGDAVEALLARFPTAETRAEAPFRLTSLMPYAGGVYFLPYPHDRPTEGDGRRRPAPAQGVQGDRLGLGGGVPPVGVRQVTDRRRG